MPYLEQYFSLRGRLPRSRYWIITTKAGMLAAVLFMIIIALASVNRNTAIVLSILVFFVYALILISTTTRRLHDLSLSAFWLVIIVPLYFMANIMSGDEMSASSPAGIASILILLAVYAVLGFVKGKSGPNKFGPDPLNEG